eukprot:3403369-Pleurochrysis_carterae.AAC.1
MRHALAVRECNPRDKRRRASCRPGHDLTQARCVLQHESARCAVCGMQTMQTHTAHATAERACSN